MSNSHPIHPVIVIPAYRRADSLVRLLTSLNAAHYKDHPVKLIISVDGEGTMEVLEKARAFKFKSGEVEVIAHANHMGLRDHIIWCGDLSLEYGGVIVLEDDLVVDPYFYDYAVEAATFYDSEPAITGIALYSQRHNDAAELPFEPLHSKYSTYFMQVGCSWGQLWTASQWTGFRDWYAGVSSKEVDDCVGLPDNVKRWAESSWKKYFNAYIVSTGKYVVYPYQTFSTNCSDRPGVHIKEASNVFQVPLRHPVRPAESYEFAPFKDQLIVYDAYMEPCGSFIFDLLGRSRDEVEVDMYGQKPWNVASRKKYILTSKKIKQRALANYPVSFKPLEMNLLYPTEFRDAVYIRLYEITENTRPSVLSNKGYFYLARYYAYLETRNLKYVKGFIWDFASYIIRFYRNKIS